MTALQSHNPTLRAFEQPQRWEDLDRAEAKLKQMSYSGTITATGILLSVCASSAVLSWDAMTPGGLFAEPVLGPGIAMIAAFVGLGLAFLISFKPKTAPYMGFVYAGVEGVFLAGISLILTTQFIAKPGPDGTIPPEATGTIFQALIVTFGIAAGMLVAYSSRIIRGGPIFNKIVMTGVIGVAIYAVGLMLLNGLLGLGMPNLFASTSAVGIGFTVVCVVLASLMLVLDFQMVEQGVKQGAPKYMEWYAAFGLLVTLVWLYVEVLRLILKLRSE
jgi:uncharacterized YccA/Bax inhibitor family protein